jgi:hypothetical protein
MTKYMIISCTLIGLGLASCQQQSVQTQDASIVVLPTKK